jgi:hypothetical protein
MASLSVVCGEIQVEVAPIDIDHRIGHLETESLGAHGLAAEITQDLEGMAVVAHLLQ